MSGFEFDFQGELNRTRAQEKEQEAKRKDAQAKEEAKASERSDAAPKSPVQAKTTPKAPTDAKASMTEGFGVDYERPSPSGGGGGSAATASPDTVGWRAFKPLPGVFKQVGGARPVVLEDDIPRGNATGLPEPLVQFIQDGLKSRYTGAEVVFPWGTYRIDERNKVFTQKSTAARYLLFDALRDADGSHVQYAKQWFVLQHPTGFDKGFDPRRHLKASSDELDIYALLFVTHLDSEPSANEHAMASADKLDLLGMNIKHLMERFHAQERFLEERLNRTDVLETVIILDRMGLLKGGLPHDTGAFVRLLEANRDVIRDMTDIVDGHVQAEEERKRTLERDARMRRYSTR